MYARAQLGAIYIFSGLGLSTMCLPPFLGGPVAILLCYAALFALLAVVLANAPDRDDSATTDVIGPSSAAPSAASINTPIRDTVAATSTGGPLLSSSFPEIAEIAEFPEIAWRWERGTAMSAGLSAGVTLLAKVVPGLAAVGGAAVGWGVRLGRGGQKPSRRKTCPVGVRTL